MRKRRPCAGVFVCGIVDGIHAGTAMERIRAAALGCAASLLVGCAATRPDSAAAPAQGDTTWHAVVPEGTRRYELALGEVSSGAALAHRVAPVYPPALLAACPPRVEVRALLVVDAAGKVDEVRFDEARIAEDGAAAGRRPYIEAVQAAAKQWIFVPLQVERWAADASGESHVVDRQARPFSLAYDFHFECHGGAAAVTTDDVPSAAAHGRP
jgi:hypothetical protein